METAILPRTLPSLLLRLIISNQSIFLSFRAAQAMQQPTSNPISAIHASWVGRSRTGTGKGVRTDRRPQPRTGAEAAFYFIASDRPAAHATVKGQRYQLAEVLQLDGIGAASVTNNSPVLFHSPLCFTLYRSSTGIWQNYFTRKKRRSISCWMPKTTTTATNSWRL